jgi:tRNA A-37 threonylcarbamoyl transferase component Bud32
MIEPPRLGKYRLLRRIAVGGVAEVYLAVAEGAAGFEKRVVVKRLMPARAREAGLVAMFLDEARLMALFHHPHVAEVYDIGAEGTERFFAMEHVDGCDLRDVLDEQPGTPLPLPAALTIVRAVALGLGHAHAQKDRAGQPLGVVHRDVSPSNVLLGRAGEVKLVDFGVAKWTSQRSHTEHGTLKGKFAYMSPEQCRGESLDGRSDLFALGVLLYEMTTGVRPFSAPSDFELMSAIVRGQFPAPAQHVAAFPAVLQEVIVRALAPRREDRFADASALVNALDRAALEIGVTPDPDAVAALLANRARTQTPALPAPPESRPDSAGRAVLDRTATDWSAAPAVPAAGSARPARLRRGSGALAVGGVGAVVIVVVLLVWPRTGGDRSGARPGPGVGVPPAATTTSVGVTRAVTSDPATAAPAAVLVPATSPSKQARPERGATNDLRDEGQASPRDLAVRGRALVPHRSPAPSAPAADPPSSLPAAPAPTSAKADAAGPVAPRPVPALPSGAGGKMIWDPDSPVPP